MGRAARGRIKLPGTGEVFLPEPADSDLSWTAKLACHESKSGKCVSFFSLAAKSVAPNLKLLFEEVPSVMMVKS